MRIVFILVLLHCSQTLAQEVTFSGHAKYQPSVSFVKNNSVERFLGDSTLHSQELDLRSNLQLSNGPLTADIQGEILGLGGTTYSTLQKQTMLLQQELSPLPTDSTRLFDLTTEALDDSDFVAVARLDRLSLRYTTEQFVFKAGRQAVSLGNGLVFHTLDLFTPFSPVAIDKDYKTGVDLLYSQYLFEDGSDLEAIVVPRRSLDTGNIDHEESSYALHYRTFLPNIGAQLSALATQHYNEWNFGAGLTFNLGEALWRTDILSTRTKNDETALSLVTNIDRSWVLAGKNVYAFIEYYRNGLGRSHRDYFFDESELTSKVLRGELFVFGRDFVSTGIQVEWAPRWTMFLNQIFHANDGSGYTQIRSEHDLFQDVLLMAGANIPWGRTGTEFGGIEVGPELYQRPSLSLYLRIALYY